MNLEQIQSKMMMAVDEEDYHLALELAHKAVDITDGERKAWCLLNVADVLMKQENYKDAGKTAIKAGQILQPMYGADSYEYAYVCLYLGKVYFHLDKYEVSRQCLDFFVQSAQNHLQDITDAEERANIELLIEDAHMGILANNEVIQSIYQ
ncbi:hypothetical protein [Candidatus Uabimicrobium amorphum]|uniref:Tetratricopeptide repeat protein n=1 Tax=Uabimicrobium amorphum TaxID=2596890 RepID=A0A5S9IJH0_UABAM|nr:hypothetical protein [Candidatus Uabimicrobium amorphum]BBM82660.1 hypothetical protein UABAM_01003 [Candidatus Uabimicrobium amorphum]